MNLKIIDFDFINFDIKMSALICSCYVLNFSLLILVSRAKRDAIEKLIK